MGCGRRGSVLGGAVRRFGQAFESGVTRGAFRNRAGAPSADEMFPRWRGVESRCRKRRGGVRRSTSVSVVSSRARRRARARSVVVTWFRPSRAVTWLATASTPCPRRPFFRRSQVSKRLTRLAIASTQRRALAPSSAAPVVAKQSDAECGLGSRTTDSGSGHLTG